MRRVNGMTDWIKYAKKTIKDGVVIFEVNSWADFNDLVCGELLDLTHYIWRGQLDSTWLLESTLDRVLKKSNKLNQEYLLQFLEKFKFSTRGRRGNNPAHLNNDDDWWALGQHHGLATPLLDWTTSPFVAAYFALAEDRVSIEQTVDPVTENKRAIFALNKRAYEEKGQELLKRNIEDIILFIKPLSDENARLVNQSGLFTKAPLGVDIEKWTRLHYANHKASVKLIKIEIPDSERPVFLKALNRMNINHLTLFPDLIGASYFCNMSMMIENY